MRIEVGGTVVNTLGKGTIFGETSFIEGSKTTTAAVIAGDILVYSDM